MTDCHLKRLRILLGVLAFFIHIPTQAQDSMNRSFRNELSIVSENDAYLLTTQDRYYTNGLYFNYRKALNPVRSLGKASYIKKIIQFEIGQAIYNPQTAFVQPDSLIYLSKIDRPFAGWLYAGVSINFISPQNTLKKFGLLIGTVGPNSYADKFQIWYHRTFGFDLPLGWETQISNELGVNLTFEYAKNIPFKNSLPRKRLDITFVHQSILGNTFTNGVAGLLFRFGKFGLIDNSISFNTRTQWNGNKEALSNEIFFFIKPTLALVLYDATMQGGIFNKDSPFIFCPTIIVGGVETGFSFAKGLWAGKLTYVFKTPENLHMYGTSYASLYFSYLF